MKFQDEYRAGSTIRALAAHISRRATRDWTVMEICGGQTHAIARYGLSELLPDQIRLVHGPGCPVCVTPIEILEQAWQLSLRPGVTLCTYGDMLRVPAVSGDLLAARAAGADVRVVLSALDAIAFAQAEPDREFVFLSVGFETTAPAAAIELAAATNLDNFSVLSAHVRVPPAMHAILGAADNTVQGFLAAGHVCTVAGMREYPAIATQYRVPIVVTGFEPVDILDGMAHLIDLLERSEPVVDNRYPRAVRPAGNEVAQAAVNKVFAVTDVPWRGFGVLPAGGLRVREAFARFDAVVKHELGRVNTNCCIVPGWKSRKNSSKSSRTYFRVNGGM